MPEEEEFHSWHFPRKPLELLGSKLIPTLRHEIDRSELFDFNLILVFVSEIESSAKRLKAPYTSAGSLARYFNSELFYLCPSFWRWYTLEHDPYLIIESLPINFTLLESSIFDSTRCPLELTFSKTKICASASSEWIYLKPTIKQLFGSKVE